MQNLRHCRVQQLVGFVQGVGCFLSKVPSSVGHLVKQTHRVHHHHCCVFLDADTGTSGDKIECVQNDTPRELFSARLYNQHDDVQPHHLIEPQKETQYETECSSVQTHPPCIQLQNVDRNQNQSQCKRPTSYKSHKVGKEFSEIRTVDCERTFLEVEKA